MNVEDPDLAVAEIAAAIGEPARARMLYCLSDGHARTSTELAVVGEVAPSTASVHLQRLKARRLVKVVAQGKHRYYALDGPNVAAALEALSVLAGSPRERFVPSTPHRLRAARTCYDHIAGGLGVSLHDRFLALGWLSPAGETTSRAPDGTARRTRTGERDEAYQVTATGEQAFTALGIDLDAIRSLRRRFAYACLDWSERRPHLCGALAAAVLDVVRRRRWVVQDLDSRALRVTSAGQRELLARFGLP